MRTGVLSVVFAAGPEAPKHTLMNSSQDKYLQARDHPLLITNTRAYRGSKISKIDPRNPPYSATSSSGLCDAHLQVTGLVCRPSGPTHQRPQGLKEHEDSSVIVQTKHHSWPSCLHARIWQGWSPRWSCYHLSHLQASSQPSLPPGLSGQAEVGPQLRLVSPSVM